MRVDLLFSKVVKDSCTVSPFLSKDVLPDDDDVRPDDVLPAPELEPEQ